MTGADLLAYWRSALVAHHGALPDDFDGAALGALLDALARATTPANPLDALAGPSAGEMEARLDRMVPCPGCGRDFDPGESDTLARECSGCAAAGVDDDDDDLEPFGAP